MSEVTKKPRLKLVANAQARSQTNDGLVNVYTGMGTGHSKSAHNQWAATGILGGPALDILYRESWLCQAIASYPADDATREWRTFNLMADEIRKEEERLGAKTATADAKTWSRVYGGSAILMITNQDLTKPLDVSAIKRGDLKKLVVIDRYDLAPFAMNMTNILSDSYLRPEWYTLVNGSTKIHWSHLVRFEGKSLPRRLAAYEHGWGDSDLRATLTDINNTVASFNGIAELMQEANVDVISKEGLANDLTTDQDQAIIERYNLFNLMKSNYGLSLLDATEKLERMAINLTGVAGVQEQLLTWISGASRIPVTRLFGTSAKGMNATGTGDRDVYYDFIRGTIQEKQLRPSLTRLDKVLVRSALGEYPEDLKFTFDPLVQLSDTEKSQQEFTDSQTDEVYLTENIVTKSQVAKRLQAKGTYEITDDDIKKFEKDENLETDFDDDNDFSDPGDEE